MGCGTGRPATKVRGRADKGLAPQGGLGSRRRGQKPSFPPCLSLPLVCSPSVKTSWCPLLHWKASSASCSSPSFILSIMNITSRQWELQCLSDVPCLLPWPTPLSRTYQLTVLGDCPKAQAPGCPLPFGTCFFFLHPANISGAAQQARALGIGV